MEHTEHTREYLVMLETCKKEGCALCRLSYEGTHRYLDAWKYELFTDVDLQKELRLSQGFCHTHTWQLAQMGAALQLAQNYRSILSDTVKQLQDAEATGSSGLFKRFFDTKQESSRPRPPCPACKQEADEEVHLVHTLRHALLDDEFYQAFAQSSGLCLHHLQLSSTLRMSDTPGNWLSQLRKGQIACLQRLDAQLADMIRKHDYRFKHEEQGPEMLSWIEAAGLVASEKSNVVI